MPNMQSIAEALRGRFASLVEGQVSTLVANSVTYDNTPPRAPGDATNWARVRVIETSFMQVSMGSPGNNRWRHKGQFVVELYTLSEMGDKDLRTTTQLIADVMRGTFSGVTMTTGPAAKPVGRVTKWWRIDLTQEWFADEFR